MSGAVRLAAFAAVLAIAFAAAAAAGAALDPEGADEAAAPHANANEAAGHAGEATRGDSAGHTGDSAGRSGDGHGGDAGGHGGGDPVRGLAVSASGLRVVVEDPELRRGVGETVRFRVVDARGATVQDFDVEHEKRMHLIIARRDLTGFQHLHPTQAEDGSWSIRVRLPEAGSYRLFADFARDGESHTLATDMRVDGAADLRPLPAPRATATTGDYEVRLDGRGEELKFAITRGGETVHTEPYLGAGGHLVALREGDLAFLHVHPTEQGDDHTTAHDDRVGFAATFPTAGRYRLFLQFKHEGRVHTVAFTREVE